MSQQELSVLWLDDDREDNYVYEEGLLKTAGWDVVWAHTLADAAAWLSKRRFDAILLDQNVTDNEDGVRGESLVWGACRVLYWLRRVEPDLPRPWLQPGEGEPWGDLQPLSDNTDVPAIVISSFHDPEVWRATIAAKPTDIRLKLLSKPIDELALLTWLRTHGGCHVQER